MESVVITEEQVQQLIEEIAKGADAEEELACYFWDQVYDIASRFELDHEKRVDIVHETLGSLLMKLRKRDFRGESSLATFIHQIVKNTAKKHIRHIKRLKRGSDMIHIAMDAELINSLETQSLLTSLDGNPLQHLEKQERDKALRQSIDSLEDREEWGILTLLAKNYDRNEISTMLDIPVQRVDKKIYCGKKKIQRHLQKQVR